MSVKSKKKVQNGMSRRQFVGATLAAAGVGVLQNNVPCYSQPALRRKSGIKLGLYSITFLGIWYRGRSAGLARKKLPQAAGHGRGPRNRAIFCGSQ
jgi:hypothetical protein